MKRRGFIGLLVTAMAAGGACLQIASVARVPTPPGGKSTPNWVINEYVPYLAGSVQDFPQGKDLEIRTQWAYRLSGSFQLTSMGAGIDGCPASLAEFERSRYLPFIPIDRFAQTPLKGSFLHEGSYAPKKDDSLLAEQKDIQDRFSEGTLIFSRRKSGSALATVFYHQDDTSGHPAVVVDICYPEKAGPAPRSALFQSGIFWKRLAANLASNIRGYVAYTGKAPASIKDLDGTVGKLNPKAWNDPEIGPILKAISDKLIPLVQQAVKPEPAMGEWEPRLAGAGQ